MNAKKILQLFLIGVCCTTLVAQGEASVGYRHGCEFPMQNMEVCWELTGDDDRAMSLPIPELHMLPISRSLRYGESEILADYTRGLYRQIVPSNLALQIHQEWLPAEYLDQAMAISQHSRWPMTLWFSPRILRDSSPTSSGIVDMDVYLLDGQKGQPLRTMRVRVTSHQEIKRPSSEYATLMGGALLGTGVAQAMGNPAFAVGAVAAASALAPQSPPEPGRPLELMTELAVRQVIHLSQFSIKDIPLAQQKENPPPPLFNLTHPALEKVSTLPPAGGVSVSKEENLLDRIVGAHQ